MHKSHPNQRKLDQVSELKDKLSRSKAFFLTDYKGLTHKQLEELKKSLKKVEGEFVVVKNTLLKKTFETSETKNKENLYEHLKQATAALFAYGDEISAIKVLSSFIKSASLPKVKIGLFAENITSAEDFNRIASLPTKEVLLASLVTRLKSPIYGLHYSLSWNLHKFVIALNNIKSKKPAN